MNPREFIHAVAEIRSKLEISSESEALEALSGCLRDFVLDPANQRLSFATTTVGLYTRILLNSPEDPFQVVLALWGPGSDSPIHDHDGTVGGVAALVGESVETKYRMDGLDGPTAKLSRSSTLVLRDGVVTPILPDEELQLHDMGNRTGDWAATVHVYLRPIQRFNLYHPNPDGTYTVEGRDLWFDGVDGHLDLMGERVTS